jgi:hemerythrin-like domain-containing protein
MADHLEGASSGDAVALRGFAAGARGYVQLLRSHIMKEDQILFPMADRLMDQSDQQALLDQFEVVESEHMGHGTHEKYLRIAESLAEKYGVSEQPIQNLSSHGGCGCGHKAAQA